MATPRQEYEKIRALGLSHSQVMKRMSGRNRATVRQYDKAQAANARAGVIDPGNAWQVGDRSIGQTTGFAATAPYVIEKDDTPEKIAEKTGSDVLDVQSSIDDPTLPAGSQIDIQLGFKGDMLQGISNNAPVFKAGSAMDFRKADLDLTANAPQANVPPVNLYDVGSPLVPGTRAAAAKRAQEQARDVKPGDMRTFREGEATLPTALLPEREEWVGMAAQRQPDPERFRDFALGGTPEVRGSYIPGTAALREAEAKIEAEGTKVLPQHPRGLDRLWTPGEYERAVNQWESEMEEYYKGTKGRGGGIAGWIEERTGIANYWELEGQDKIDAIDAIEALFSPNEKAWLATQGFLVPVGTPQPAQQPGGVGIGLSGGRRGGGGRAGGGRAGGGGTSGYSGGGGTRSDIRSQAYLGLTSWSI